MHELLNYSRFNQNTMSMARIQPAFLFLACCMSRDILGFVTMPSVPAVVTKQRPGCSADNVTCHHGNCVEDEVTWKCSCFAGYQGQLCQEPCPPNFYGDDCSSGCVNAHFCLDNLPCDHVTGECFRLTTSGGKVHGCDPGWEGPSCNQVNKYALDAEFKMVGGNFDENLINTKSYEYTEESDQLKTWLLPQLLHDYKGINAKFLEKLDKYMQASGKNTEASDGGGVNIEVNIADAMEDSEPDMKHASQLDLSGLGLDELYDLARTVGLGIDNIRFSGQDDGLLVKFEVQYPTETTEPINIQMQVRDVLLDGTVYTPAISSKWVMDTASIKVGKERKKEGSMNKMSLKVKTLVIYLSASAGVLVFICTVITLYDRYGNKAKRYPRGQGDNNDSKDSSETCVADRDGKGSPRSDAKTIQTDKMMIVRENADNIRSTTRTKPVGLGKVSDESEEVDKSTDKGHDVQTHQKEVVDGAGKGNDEGGITDVATNDGQQEQTSEIDGKQAVDGEKKTDTQKNATSKGRSPTTSSNKDGKVSKSVDCKLLMAENEEAQKTDEELKIKTDRQDGQQDKKRCISDPESNKKRKRRSISFLILKIEKHQNLEADC